MKETKYKTLRQVLETYPDYFPHLEKYPGMYDDHPHWLGIIAKLIAHIDFNVKHNGWDPPEIGRIKEKFGYLTIQGKMTQNIRVLVEFASSLASMICEWCGDSPTKLSLGKAGYRRIICDMCAEKYDRGLMPWLEGWDANISPTSDDTG